MTVSDDMTGTPARCLGPFSVDRAGVAADHDAQRRQEDERWMRVALRQAAAAAALGEVPVGAVIVRGGQQVALGHNLTHTLQDPSAHAEMVAIRRAAQALGEWRLLDCTLYVTLEPCAMCSGAIVLARVPRLVFAAHDPKAGMSGSLANLVQHPRLNHRVQLTTGVLADEAGETLRAFFRARRRGRANPLDACDPSPGATSDQG
ncbi:MAG TPA: tRNA adenosine(34) deaminase TadA [Longimicrobium sp.]|uniref:tRNA adenosine(34) deaminase TadA n=1 Tax=Longimicrobium sp. TaxID=2029185 RepID=UPI002ED90498